MQINLFDDLLVQPMTRKEFLLHLGVLLFAVMGISGLLKTLADPNIVNNHRKPKQHFGSGSYGG